MNQIVIFGALMNSNLNKFIFITALVLLFGQGANQVFCGDIDCLEGGSSENCTTLLCSILGSHTNAPTQSSGQNQDQDNDCHCVCHLQFNSADIELIDLRLTSTGQVIPEPVIYTNFIFHRIYHPPAA